MAPAVSLTPVAALTNNPKPSFSGGAGVAPGDIASVTLKIYVGESVSGRAPPHRYGHAERSHMDAT